MMKDEERFYRAQFAESTAAADATTPPKVKAKHLAAARSWQSLIDVFEARRAPSPDPDAAPKFGDCPRQG